MKKILISILMTASAFAQVNGKFAKVDATQGYTVNGSAPNNQVLCGNGTTAVFTPSCGTVSVPFYQTIQTNGTPLPQRNLLNFDSNFTVNDTSPSSTVHLASTITSTAANANAVGGVSLAGLCQTSGSGCPASGITGVVATSGYIVFPNGLIYQWMPGPSVTESGNSLHSGSWPIPFPNAVFGANCSTKTGQGGPGSPGDTDIHVMQISAISTSSWTVRHSVGGVYAQSQTVSCFLTAIGN